MANPSSEGQKFGGLPVQALRNEGYEIQTDGERKIIDLSYQSIKAGISARLIGDVRRNPLFERGDFNPIISGRTLERRISNNDPLKPDEADGVARLLRVVAHAVRVFEHAELAEEWLRSPNPTLNDEVPMTMAATDVGAREVEGVLSRLEHGVFD